ncbi:conserved Plasmodium protein, unknown function [Plasmodium ovale]|uniref:Uncharacterized protein n=2 Tax=Plasmodium ovale TaxID=36330 RepID=A0A1A8X1A6_PLAOA|nr:conserved Plasmodium protein, unknown function [Plasmodium ovale curtisi]SBS97947.1 conserved Plasmodium protein, unknown function [Plasmodium ovale curtisi]SCQ16729.1 conserved Plasmodium protein, unknown function [Plasmodium ovale]
MYPLSDAKLEKMSNNELIGRIMELQSNLIIISDNMELLKNKNKMLDEENDSLQKHIKNIVNKVKIESTNNFDKTKSTPSKYTHHQNTQKSSTKNSQSCSDKNNIQKEGVDVSKFKYTNIACTNLGKPIYSADTNIHDNNSMLSRNTDNRLCSKKIHGECINKEGNIKTIERVYARDHKRIEKDIYHDNKKKDGDNSNFVKDQSTKSNIYNLIMETEKLNSIFNIASNVLNTSFFNMSKEQDDKKSRYQNNVKHENTYPSSTTNDNREEVSKSITSCNSSNANILDKRKANWIQKNNTKCSANKAETRANTVKSSCISEAVSCTEGEERSENVQTEKNEDIKGEVEELKGDNGEHIKGEIQKIGREKYEHMEGDGEDIKGEEDTDIKGKGIEEMKGDDKDIKVEQDKDMKKDDENIKGRNGEEAKEEDLAEQRNRKGDEKKEEKKEKNENVEQKEEKMMELSEKGMCLEGVENGEETKNNQNKKPLENEMLNESSHIVHSEIKNSFNSFEMK